MKKCKGYILPLCCIVIVGCSNETNKQSYSIKFPSFCQEQSFAGGWSRVGVNIQGYEALAFALKAIGKEATEAHITRLYTQVVNGTNYAIEFEVDGVQHYHTQIYRTLQGEMSLTVPPQLGKLCP